MGRHDTSNKRQTFACRLLALLGMAGLLGAPLPVQANLDTPRARLEARVLAVREGLLAAPSEDSAAPVGRLVAQWYNWPNWNNWNNWPNWGNWGNWGNWFNN